MKPTTGTSNSRSLLVNILKEDEETSSPSKQKERNKMTENTINEKNTILIITSLLINKSF